MKARKSFNQATVISLFALTAGIVATTSATAATFEIKNDARAYLWVECAENRTELLSSTRTDRNQEAGFDLSTRKWRNADGNLVTGIKKLTDTGLDSYECIVYPGKYPYKPGGNFMNETTMNYLDELYSVGGSKYHPRGIPRWFNIKRDEQLRCGALVVKKIAGMWGGTTSREWYAEPHCVIALNEIKDECQAVPVGALAGVGDIDDNNNAIRDEFEVMMTLPNSETENNPEGVPVHSTIVNPDLNRNLVHDSYEACLTGGHDNDGNGIDDGTTVPVAHPVL